MKKLTTEQFIEKAQNVHNGLYDYSLSEYINNKTPVKIICKEHGVFEQTPNKHLAGHKCPYCNPKQKLNTQEFIKKASLVHTNIYNYKLTVYKNIDTPVDIICNIHGIFKMSPYHHLKGRGCQLCSRNLLSKANSCSQSEFIEKAQNIHNGLYDYSIVQYVNSKTLIKIICHIHGVFEQLPKAHLEGQGCPKCKQSKGELKIAEWLELKGIEYETQKKFSELGNLSYDFYIPQMNLLIEYNGIQHYQFVKLFHKTLHDFHLQKHNDWLKRRYANRQDIRMLVIPYWDFNNIDNILDNVI